MGAFLDHEQVSLPDAVRDSLGRDVLADPESLPPETYSELATDLSRFPLRQQLTPPPAMRPWMRSANVGRRPLHAIWSRPALVPYGAASSRAWAS
jgi:hypothetical protein